MASARTWFAVERREDPGRELGAAAAIDQTQQLVKVVAGIACDRVRQGIREAGLPQALDPPREQAFAFAGSGHLSL